MTNLTNWIRGGAGLLWLAGLWLCLRQPASVSPAQQDAVDTLSSAKSYLFTSPSGTTLLLRGSDQLTRITLTDTALLLNKDVLSFRSDSANKAKVPGNLSFWRSQFRYRLGTGTATDDARWEIARRKLVAFYTNSTTLPADLLPANDKTDQLLLSRFITFVADRQRNSQESTLILYNNLILSRLDVQNLADNQRIEVVSPDQSISEPDSSTSLLGIGLLALGGLLWGTLGLMKRDKPVEVPRQTIPDTPAVQEPVKSIISKEEPIIAPEPQLVPVITNGAVDAEWQADQEALKQYLTAFYQHYGDFYDRLQTLSTELTDTEKQQIRRQLVEMALHAHSFVEGYQHLPLTRLIEIPNVRLLVQSVGSPPAPELTNDPYETPKRFRVLLAVLQDMQLGELENVLLQDLHIPKNLL